MFGMGFTEILFIAVIAVLFLGPEKLPDAMVQIAKLFKSVRGTINEAKSSFEDEIHIKELREEALGYRKKIEEASHDISGFKNAIPNPAAELQDAITSIGGDRYLDDDLLADIHEAEQAGENAESESLETETSASENGEDVSSDETPTTEKPAPKKKSKKKSTKKSKEKPSTFRHLPDEDNA